MRMAFVVFAQLTALIQRLHSIDGDNVQQKALYQKSPKAERAQECIKLNILWTATRRVHFLLTMLRLVE